MRGARHGGHHLIQHGSLIDEAAVEASKASRGFNLLAETVEKPLESGFLFRSPPSPAGT